MVRMCTYIEDINFLLLFTFPSPLAAPNMNIASLDLVSDV
jgi:hypothetical protein